MINRYDVDMANEEEWFERWLEYVFERRVKGIDGTETTMFERFIPIKRAKYPATSEEEEEEASIPLQALYLCAFDAALVRVATRAAGSFEGWQKIRAELVDSLVKCKAERADVLEKCLLSPAEDAEDDDETLSVCFLQEVGASFVEGMRARARDWCRGTLFSVPRRWTRRETRIQFFSSPSRSPGDDDVVEATGDIMASLGEASSKFSKGDFCAFIVRGVLLCSFHGDTDGLQTKTIVAAANASTFATTPTRSPRASSAWTPTRTSRTSTVKNKAFAISSSFSRERPRSNRVGRSPASTPRETFTTFSARTHLQAQLNKAVPRAEVLTSPLTDRHPKDHVLIYAPDDTGRETTTTTRPPPSVRRVQRRGFLRRRRARGARFRPRRLLPERQIPVRSRGRRVHDALATLTHLDSPSLARTRAFRVPRARLRRRPRRPRRARHHSFASSHARARRHAHTGHSRA